MDKQTITIYDVAREAGVSMATVSRVVNGNPNVKPSTRKKVSDVIERLQYRPNAVARGLASKKTTTVGVIIPSVTNIFFASLARGIDDIAAMYRYNIILANSDESTERKLKVFNSFLASQVDGIIIIGHNLDQKLVDEVKRTSTPVVFAGGIVEDPDIHSVVIDFQEATRQVTDLLIKRNRHVGIITGPDEYMNNKVRIDGYKQALEDNGLVFKEDCVASADYTEKDGKQILDSFLVENIDSVVVSQDTIAAAVMNAALDKGMRVPEEFAVFPSNNSIIAELVRPQLSCIQLPLYDIGAVAMRLLTKLMDKEEVEEKHVVLPHRLIERGSTL